MSTPLLTLDLTREIPAPLKTSARSLRMIRPSVNTPNEAVNIRNVLLAANVAAIHSWYRSFGTGAKQWVVFITARDVRKAERLINLMATRKARR